MSVSLYYKNVINLALKKIKDFIKIYSMNSHYFIKLHSCYLTKQTNKRSKTSIN